MMRLIIVVLFLVSSFAPAANARVGVSSRQCRPASDGSWRVWKPVGSDPVDRHKYKWVPTALSCRASERIPTPYRPGR